MTFSSVQSHDDNLPSGGMQTLEPPSYAFRRHAGAKPALQSRATVMDINELVHRLREEGRLKLPECHAA